MKNDANALNELAMLAIHEVAATLGVSERTVYRLIADGEFVKLPVRGSARVPMSSLRAYVNRLRRAN